MSARSALSSLRGELAFPITKPGGAQMDRRTGKIAALNLAAYIIMISGILLFVLTPLFIRYLKFDTDVLGILIVIVGFAVLIVGRVVMLVVKRVRSRKST
jgi:hypothetical protein